MAIATFGAGCFWGIEEIYRTTEGVTETSVGYCGGNTDKPSYENVCSGKTGHAEVVQVHYDPHLISYDNLADIFFNNHNPTQLNHQGPDVGTQYRSVIFYHNDKQKAVAIDKIKALKTSGRFQKPVVTAVEQAPTFWPAEEYHQQYLAKRGMSSCHI